MREPHATHTLDQFAAYFGSLGTAYAAFVRQAVDAGAPSDEAARAGRAMIRAWVSRPFETPQGPGRD